MNISQFVITVRDYGQAIAVLYRQARLYSAGSTPLDERKRWVRVSPSENGAPAINGVGAGGPWPGKAEILAIVNPRGRYAPAPPTAARYLAHDLTHPPQSRGPH